MSNAILAYPLLPMPHRGSEFPTTTPDAAKPTSLPLRAPNPVKKIDSKTLSPAAKPLKKKAKKDSPRASAQAPALHTHLTVLGDAPTVRASKSLEVFPNPAPERDLAIHMQIPEFTCLCPKTGQPDFATLYLDYIPEKRCVELKSLKLYIWSFRDEGKFHEAVTNEILGDIVKATSPRFARLTAKFWVRGGIFTTVVAEHRAKGWKPQPRVELSTFADGSSVTER